MKYKISSDVIFKYNSLKEHYIGWALIGDYTINNVIKKEKNYTDIACYGCLFQPKQNAYSFEDNSIIFDGADIGRVIGNKQGYGVKNTSICLIDYGNNNINLEQEISNSINYQDEALEESDLIVEHKWCPSRELKVIYEQKLDKNEELINRIKFYNIVVGKLKVNLEGLEK